MKFITLIVFSFASLLSSYANATDYNNFSYYGFSLERNNYKQLDFTPDIETLDLTPSLYTEKTSGTGFRAFMGYQVNPYFGLEAGIFSHPKAKFSVYNEITTVDPVDPSIITMTNETVYNGNFKTLSADIRIIGTYPLTTKWFVKAQVGSLFWDNEFDYLTMNADSFVVESKSEHGVSLLTGVGLGYGFSKSVAISLDFEHSKIAEAKYNAIAFSIMFRY